MSIPLSTDLTNFDMQALFNILEKKLKGDPKGWALVETAWDAPAIDEDWLTFQDAAWQYRVGILHEGQPKRIRLTPYEREATLRSVGDAADKLLELLRKSDRVTRRMCIPPDEESAVLTRLKSITERAYQGAEIFASEKAAPNGPRSGKRNLLLENLLLETGTILLSKNGKVGLVKEVARIIDWWARGRPRTKDHKPVWHINPQTHPDFGEAPWERIRLEVRERLSSLFESPEDRQET